MYERMKFLRARFVYTVGRYCVMLLFLLKIDRGECPKKKKLGQEIGKAAAEKSRGLFR